MKIRLIVPLLLVFIFDFRWTFSNLTPFTNAIWPKTFFEKLQRMTLKTNFISSSVSASALPFAPLYEKKCSPSKPYSFVP
jgi:hypothetical protein